jgi:hypothetical protein
MTRRFYTTLLVALAGAVLTPAAEACQCGFIGPPCVAFAQTPVVFAGRVSEISKLSTPGKTGKNDGVYSRQLVRFDVEENFRGEPRKVIEVTTGFGGGDCGFHFRTGERYLVYAGEFPQQRLYTSICTRTRPLSEVASDLDFLRKRGDPGRGAGLEGTILELGRDPKTNATPTRGMMRGVRVVVERAGEKWEATTDDQGWFRVWGLPPGEYSVRAVLPRNFVPEATMRKVLVTQKTCGWVHMLATPYAFPDPKR